MVVRLTPDQKVGGSIPSGVIFRSFFLSSVVIRDELGNRSCLGSPKIEMDLLKN